MKQIDLLEKELLPLRTKLLAHDLYQNINTIEDIQLFMESHVFAVWDFMSLLKALQIELTCISVPWLPRKQPLLTKFVNEIVIAEESDLNISNEPMSHFEMYLDAMQEVGASTAKIDALIKQLTHQHDYQCVEKSVFPSRANQVFTDFTFETIATKKAHLIASSFTFGRENLIPDMFVAIVKKLNNESHQKYKKLVYYLDRHIEIDQGEHGPMSLRMIEALCGRDADKWQESVQISKQALIKRLALWDSINEEIIRANTNRSV